MEALETTGGEYRDFLLTKNLQIKELHCTLKELVHIPSGAQIMYLGSEDAENLFSLSFKTLPGSSNGAAHILEHTVLCGSRKYPVKDPFFSMSRRSLNTFMNALTGPDFTCYPAASQVEKDFYNLLDVYLDAVFHPKLGEFSFLQEGWRLEFADPGDPTSALEYRGIVYNEMKGSLSSAEVRIWHAMMQQLLPDLPYAHNSGGDPREIPKLSYDELIAFHETFYHPSRCLFFFYGNIPLKHHLDFLAERALKNVPKERPLQAIPLQKRMTQPKKVAMRYPLSQEEGIERKAIAAFGWLTAPLTHQEDILALSVLDAVLMESDASLLKHALLETGLCLEADGFMDMEMSEVPYLIICKGCQEEQIDTLKEHLFEALRSIIKRGIPQKMVDSAIHQLEFERVEINGEQGPFGLTLFMRSALAKQHGCPAENALMVHAHFAHLLKKIHDPAYLPGILQKYLLDNPHFVQIAALPDLHLIAEELTEERERLKKIRADLGEEQTAQLLCQSEALRNYQKEVETQSLDCLPKVTLEDVPIRAQTLLLKEERWGGLQLHHHPCFTNQILYADLLYPLPPLTLEELPYVKLLASLLSEIGSGGRGYRETLEYAQAHTGAIGARCGISTHVNHPEAPLPFFAIRGKALSRKKHELFSLLSDMATDARFDETKRLEELIRQLFSRMQSQYNRNALRYATQLSLSGFSQTGLLQNLWHGLSYFRWMEKLVPTLEQEVASVAATLAALHEKIVTSASPEIVLCCEEPLYEELKREGFAGFALPSYAKRAPWSPEFPLLQSASQGHAIASPVAFNVQAFRTASYLHPHAPALFAATELMENTLLHKEVRERGGAYGAGATYLPLTGFFYFYSYRDPHIARTLAAFDSALERIAAGGFTASDLEEAKLGVIQALDTPISPGHRALTAYSWQREGREQEVRQHFRDRLLALTAQDVRLALEKELLPRRKSSVVTAFSGKELLEQENQKLPSPLTLF